jgi:hypothetical protein
MIQTSKEAPIEYVEQYFPVKQWTDAYAHNKWRSYVYAPRDLAGKVRDTAISLLLEQFGMKIDLKKSNETCHL